MEEANYEKVFVCSCWTEGVLVRRFKDETEVYLGLWGYKSNQAPFRARLKYCWSMLRYGYSADEVVLSKEVANELAEELSK